jgi:hypothetical protein
MGGCWNKCFKWVIWPIVVQLNVRGLNVTAPVTVRQKNGQMEIYISIYFEIEWTNFFFHLNSIFKMLINEVKFILAKPVSQTF